MKRALRFVVFAMIPLAVVPFLPLYVERTLVRSWRVDRAGDQIEWGWKITSLRDFWSNYNYMTRAQRPNLWLGLDMALAVLYALVIAIVLDQIFARRKKTAR